MYVRCSKDPFSSYSTVGMAQKNNFKFLHLFLLQMHTYLGILERLSSGPMPNLVPDFHGKFRTVAKEVSRFFLHARYRPSVTPLDLPRRRLFRDDCVTDRPGKNHDDSIQRSRACCLGELLKLVFLDGQKPSFCEP